MCDLKQSAETVILKIRPHKTKILINQSTNRRKEVEIDSIKVEKKSSCENAEYLGQRITFQQQETAERRVGHRSAGTNKSLHQNRISYNTDSAYSTWGSRRRWATPQALGLYQINTKEWYDQLNAKCFASSSKQRENTKRKLNPAGTTQMKKTKKRTTEVQMKKLQRVSVQTQITTKTAIFSSWKTPMKRLTQSKLRKKIGLNAWKEAQLQQLKRWKQPKSHAELKRIEEWNGDWQWELHRYQTNDGQRKPQNGTQTSAPSTRQTDQCEDQKKRWEDEINDILKLEETEETKGNERKNTDTWIKVATNRERWKAMESECATTAAKSVDSLQSKSNPPQDPVRQARYLNSAKLDEYEVANKMWPHTRDQTGFDGQGSQQMTSSARSSSTSMLLERREVGWVQHHAVTHTKDQADIANEPSHEIKLQRIEAWMDSWAQTTPMTESAALFPKTLFTLSNESMGSATLLMLPIFSRGTLCVDVILNSIWICHSKCLLILFSRATLYTVQTRVPRVSLALWARRTDTSDSFCVGSWPQHSCPQGKVLDSHWRPYMSVSWSLSLSLCVWNAVGGVCACEMPGGRVR